MAMGGTKHSDLQEFISETLRAVLVGVLDASGTFQYSKGDPGALTGKKIVLAIPPEITFDIAVTASESTSDTGGGGMNVTVVRADASRTKGKETTAVSRVQFTVQMDLKEDSD